MKHKSRPRRGDIHWVRLDPAVGTEVKKTRPAVILSNDSQNRAGLRVVAAPVTSNVERVYSFETMLQLKGRPSKAMVDQVRCLDQSRLGEYIATVTPQEARDLDRALRVVFDLT